MSIFDRFNTFILVGTADSNSSDGCGKHIPNQPHNGHSHRFYVHVNDPNMGRIERNYLVHVPLHFKRTNDVAVPLILDYHGWYGTASMLFVIVLIYLNKIQKEVKKYYTRMRFLKIYLSDKVILIK